MAHDCLLEDFPHDIEREACSKWDRVVVGRGRERQFIGGMGRRLVGGIVRHVVVVQAWEDVFFFVIPPFLSCRG